MTSPFEPTRAPGGRLTRLGVVFDASTEPARMTALARMSERAGIDAIWIAESIETPADGPASDALELSLAIAADLGRARLGVLVDPRRRLPADLVAAVADLSERTAARVEVSILASEVTAAYSAALVVAFAALGGPRITISALVERPDDLADFVEAIDDVVLAGWSHADLERAAAVIRTASGLAGRDPATLGIAALIPVSIGRTGAEASARADHDPVFARFGHPAEIGVYGTLEECQDQVIALAHAGVSDLRCILPAAPDVHDVIAQLTAMVVGTTDVLRPGSVRSPAPPPPAGWGGRGPKSHPSVSDDSTRR